MLHPSTEFHENCLPPCNPADKQTNRTSFAEVLKPRICLFEASFIILYDLSFFFFISAEDRKELCISLTWLHLTSSQVNDLKSICSTCQLFHTFHYLFNWITPLQSDIHIIVIPFFQWRGSEVITDCQVQKGVSINLSCKCHSVSDYNRCQLSISLKRERYGPLVYKRHMLFCIQTDKYRHLYTNTTKQWRIKRVWSRAGDGAFSYIFRSITTVSNFKNKLKALRYVCVCVLYSLFTLSLLEMKRATWIKLPFAILYVQSMQKTTRHFKDCLSLCKSQKWLNGMLLLAYAFQWLAHSQLCG